MSFLKNLFCFFVFYLFLIFTSYANSADFDNELFPSKNCLSKIILTDELINAKNCLVSGEEIDGIYETNIFGDPIIKLDFEGDNSEYFLASYYNKKFPGARPHWVLTIDYSTGGSGLYSVFMVLLQTRDDNIETFYVENRGDRCADGLSNVISVSSAERLSALTTRRATLFRLFNPLDDTNWWNERNITVFEGFKDEEVRIYFNKISKSPLFEDLIPFFDINHCFNCCAGHVLYEQSITSKPLANGEYLNVQGVIFDIKEISKYVKSENKDGCLSKSLVDHINEFEDFSDDRNLKYLEISKWSNVKKDITRECFK